MAATDPSAGGLAAYTDALANQDLYTQLRAVQDIHMVPLGDFTVTCYIDRGITYTGTYTTSRVAAVDPAVIPLGSRFYIPGVGMRAGAADSSRR